MKKYLILFAGCTLLMAACSDFLELDESVYQTTKYQFSTFDRVKQSATNVYSYVQEGLLDVEGTMIDAATDDAVYAWSTGGIKRFYDGSWNGTNLIDDRWASLYSAIAAANYFLDNCPDDFPEAQYQDNYKTNLAELKNYPFEVRALRAYFHFELLRRYNRIVIGDRSFTMQEVNTLVPVSYDDAAGWIVSECDAVIPSLPKTYLGTEKGEVARVTKGMAMALKARMLLYAASPLNNPGGDAGRYLEAAAAAKELIDAGIYKLVSEETTNNADAQGLIFGKWCPVSSDFEAANFPVGFEGGNSGVCPSQNLAEAFDMATGEPFDWNDESMRSRMFVASARDPRFARTLIYNGATFKGQPVQSYVGGRNGRPLDGATPTSYYLRKHIVEATSFVTGSEMSYQHIFPFFRYAEVLLNYAEALAAATQNPDFTGMKGEVEYTLSPREALNAVRARYNMPGITETDYAAFVKRLRNECGTGFRGASFLGHPPLEDRCRNDEGLWAYDYSAERWLVQLYAVGDPAARLGGQDEFLSDCGCRAFQKSQPRPKRRLEIVKPIKIRYDEKQDLGDIRVCGDLLFGILRRGRYVCLQSRLQHSGRVYS